MARPRKYTPKQITAIHALLALNPPVDLPTIAIVTGVKFDTVRYHAQGRSKIRLPEPWGIEIQHACEHAAHGKNPLAAYYLVSAAKILLNSQ